MQYTLKLDQFEGPLELLLSLIEDEKLDITTISLAKVTDQYLAYLERHEELPPDEVADFLVVAAKLIYIKSKYLLPSLQLEDDDSNSLEQQLKMYREYYEASKVINRLIGKQRFTYARQYLLRVERDIGFTPPKNVTMHALAAAFLSVITRIDTMLKLPKIQLKRTVSIREKINMLKRAVEQGILRFHTMYDTANKYDAIVSFLALLELIKMRHVAVQQTRLFSDIIIRKHSFYG